MSGGPSLHFCQGFLSLFLSFGTAPSFATFFDGSVFFKVLWIVGSALPVELPIELLLELANFFSLWLYFIAEAKKDCVFLSDNGDG